MIIAVLVLCAVWAHSSDGLAARELDCTPRGQEVSCVLPADYLNASGSVSVKACGGKKLNISLMNFSGQTACNWSRAEDPQPIVKGNFSMVLQSLSAADSGEYTLSCETSSGTQSSLTMSLHVVLTPPTTPQLILVPSRIKLSSPEFQCVSKGFPTPTIKWFKSLDKSGEFRNGHDSTHSETAESKEDSSRYSNTAAMCCAANTAGEECSQLYDYDLDSGWRENDEVSEVILSPGQPLLLRCRMRSTGSEVPKWEGDSKIINASTVKCSAGIKHEICTLEDSHHQFKMSYLFISSVNVKHSGIYTCRNTKTKSVRVRVEAESFLSVQMDRRKTVSVQKTSSFCLEANVSFHPVLQHCAWEDPDKNITHCQKLIKRSNHRTLQLCAQQKSGDYKLHLKAGGQNETSIISVCLAETADFKCRVNSAVNTYTCETTSPGPANFSWMSCSVSNDSCETGSAAWRGIPGTSQQDSDLFCNKRINSSLNMTLVDGSYFKFCLTNEVGFRCSDLLQYQPAPQPLMARHRESSNTLLKVGSLFLLLVLAVVSVALMYFVKKKKPQYQSQLQMIQMVGPNDNDYIYINFKDFQYDQKWEFPRENLELGKELGSGAFGMVVQATAYGINKPGVSQQVAVKMLKEKHQIVEKEALMSELKMLTHIGHHANIVNLLGACTGSGPTYLIFQYCCYGDLLNYLKNNRERYHKSLTDAFNKDCFSNLYHNLQPKRSSSEFQVSVEDYIPMYPSHMRRQEKQVLLTSSPVDTSEDPELFEESEEQPGDVQTLTYDDLLSFAYQVAKGMEFLSSKNCIHRDLAARNVLVTTSRKVKIGDFGLARDIDNDCNYVVRGNVRLPVKWMAPESIFEGMYTMQSDVWAYGILLWEIFSLGVTPYPGVKVDNKFYSMIERGFQMECPYYASKSVYEMMCKCWDLVPSNRPPFSKLVAFMDNQLTDMEEKLYHNMLDQNSNDSVYQNTPATLDITALAKEKDEQTQSCNQYCLANASGEVTTASDSNAVETDGKYWKTFDAGSE
ncbi:receptor-type tyrosine-protein kinase FLT3 [Myripristis murdjan]|uniref:receptor-type tyrosine-protein kinase FLT3 n=1 Tax=Myripristis murdjan TaxID=586833 RepID=UPI0011763CE7|nr:receptor-type tyrosine-protein kinase FLT3 [Myripristis murdjan]